MRAQMAPISLAKLTLSAWKLLSTYFVISATRDRHPEAWAGQPLVQVHDHRCRCARSLSPTTVLGGSRKSRTLVALAQELGVETHPEVDARPLARRLLEPRDQQFLAGSRHHGAAVYDNVPAVLARRARRRSRRSPAPGTSSTAHRRDPTACRHRPARCRCSTTAARRIGGNGEVACVNDLGGEVADPFLDDRRPALSEIDSSLPAVYVDADHAVPARRQAGGGDAADVAEPENTDRHLARLLTTCSPPLTGRENGPLVTAPDMTAVDRQSRIRRRALTTSTISRSRRPSRSLRFRYRPRVDSAQQGNARRPVRRDLGTLRPTSQDGDPGLEAVGPPPEVGLDVAP